MSDFGGKMFFRVFISFIVLTCVVFSSCSKDDEENLIDSIGQGSTDEGESSVDSDEQNSTLILGTWIAADGVNGYAFSDDGTCVVYDHGVGYPGTYIMTSSSLTVYLDAEPEDPEKYVRISVEGNCLRLTEENGNVEVLYKQSTPYEERYVFLGDWVEDTDFATRDNAAMTFDADGSFSYALYNYGTLVEAEEGEWWLEYDEGEMELHVYPSITEGSSCYFIIEASSSSYLRLREEHDDEIFTLHRRGADDVPDEGGTAGESYGERIVGTWTVYYSDPSWKSTTTFYGDGTYRSVDYYDIEGDQSFAELDGTYYGTYVISGSKIEIAANNPDNASVIVGEYDIREITSGTFEFEYDGFYVNGER